MPDTELGKERLLNTAENKASLYFGAKTLHVFHSQRSFNKLLHLAESKM